MRRHLARGTPIATGKRVPVIEHRPLVERRRLASGRVLGDNAPTARRASTETTMPAPSDPIITLHPADDVAIARAPLPAGTSLRHDLEARSDIPAGHKVALRSLAQGDQVRRYNQTIGVATRAIAPGEHVHVQNLGMLDYERDHEFGADARRTQYEPEPATFEGIVRADGRVATRNYVGILSSVNCSATAARMIADHFRGRLHDYPNVDGVVALTHKSGCGLDAPLEGMRSLRRCLAGFARHPNFAAVVVVGLGCEIRDIREVLDGATGETLVIQELGGTANTVREGVARVEAALPAADRVTRQPVPLRELKVALQCGGSDGYSGISANPALGAAVDRLVRHGGTAILSETTETYGAEHLLTRRAVSREVGEKLLARVRWWEAFTAGRGLQINNNPSPGNKTGGLTTILEKSLGAIAKGGTTNLVDVYGYAEPVTSQGLVFMDAPAFDAVGATAQVAGGANLMCFTTGRGSVFGCKPTPCIKLATHTPLFQRMRDDMDVNCGTILDGVETIDAAGERIFRMMLEVASGKRTKSEELGFGDEEFAPWDLGVIL